MARSGVIYGDTGTFKTTAIAHLARYVADKTGKCTLLFSADGGGWGPCQEEVEAGMIRPYRCDTATIPLPILRKVSQGYWPSNPAETDIAKVDFKPVPWEEVGAVAIEGFTSIGTMLMRHAADKNLKTGEEGTTPFSMPIMVNGEIRYETFAGNSRGHYNFVQNQLYGLTMNFISWPVEYVLFTGHEKKTEENDRTTIYGVAVPGKAITAIIPTWVGDCIHAQDYQVENLTRVEKPGKRADGTQDFEEVKTFDTRCRYYFKKHPDPVTGICYPAKPRVSHSVVRELDKKFPGGYFEPTPEHGFDLYLKALDDLTAGKADTLKDWRQRADEKLGRAKPQPIAVIK
ncbi:MAG: hypothetical protein WA804_01685 [Terriglobales bacterium]|jgi:hypothetical protein